jgi:hypothetical protein
MFGEENIHEDLVNTTSKYHVFILFIFVLCFNKYYTKQ